MIIKLRIKSLEKGWHDKDEIMLHAVFQLLVDFIEKEKPQKVIDWNATKESKKAWKELSNLYKWWTKIRPARKVPIEDKNLKTPKFKTKKIKGKNLHELIQPDKIKYADYYKAVAETGVLEKKWYEEDQANFHRLIDLRNYLWS